VGGNIFIRKSVTDSNKSSRLRTRNGFSDDSEDSCSEQNSSENETEFLSNPMRILNALKLNNLNDLTVQEQQR